MTLCGDREITAAHADFEPTLQDGLWSLRSPPSRPPESLIQAEANHLSATLCVNPILGPPWRIGPAAALNRQGDIAVDAFLDAAML